METSYTCDFNFAVLDSRNLFVVKKVLKTIKSALWDLWERVNASVFIEVRFTVNKGSDFRDFDRRPLRFDFI